MMMMRMVKMVMMMMKIMMKMIRPDCKFWSVFLSFRRASCVLYLWKRKKDQRVRDENILPGFVGADLPRGVRRGNWGVLGSSTVWDPSLYLFASLSFLRLSWKCHISNTSLSTINLGWWFQLRWNSFLKVRKSRSKFDSSLVTMALREELANDCNFQKMSSISCGEGRSRQFHVLKAEEQDEDHFFWIKIGRFSILTES